jgi:hypothetical protein
MSIHSPQGAQRKTLLPTLAEIRARRCISKSGVTKVPLNRHLAIADFN